MNIILQPDEICCLRLFTVTSISYISLNAASFNRRNPGNSMGRTASNKSNSLLYKKRLDFWMFLGGGFKYLLCSSLWGNDPIWRAYFSDGLKPPTRFIVLYMYPMFKIPGHESWLLVFGTFLEPLEFPTAGSNPPPIFHLQKLHHHEMQNVSVCFSWKTEIWKFFGT